MKAQKIIKLRIDPLLGDFKKIHKKLLAIRRSLPVSSRGFKIGDARIESCIEALRLLDFILRRLAMDLEDWEEMNSGNTPK